MSVERRAVLVQVVVSAVCLAMAVGCGGRLKTTTPVDSGTSAPLADAAEASSRAGYCADPSYVGPPLAEATVTATPLQTGFRFLEGPVWFADLGALFFSDFGRDTGSGPPSIMHKLTWPSTFEDFVPTANSNGLAIAPDGQILACTHDLQTLSLFDPTTGARTVLDLTFEGHTFNSPNDVTVRSDGHIYFTDPDWQLGRRRTSQTQITGVYHVTPEHTVELVDGTLPKPNGITLSPDEKTLYVDTFDGQVVKYDVLPDGSTGAATPFASAPAPDGMTVDCAGNLYVTSNGAVKVFSPEGVSLATVSNVPSASNVAFGGPDRKTLFITAGTTLFTAPGNIPGSPY